MSSRPFTLKDADYRSQMLSDIDHLIRPISYAEFMRDYAPQVRTDLSKGTLRKAREILVQGLDLRYSKDKIREQRLYPVLVSELCHPFGGNIPC